MTVAVDVAAVIVDEWRGDGDGRRWTQLRLVVAGDGGTHAQGESSGRACRGDETFHVDPFVERV
jgi:hypothetical protein